MIGTPRRSPRTALRMLLWTLAAAFGVGLVVLGAGSANATPTSDDGEAGAPVGDLLSDLTDGDATPLTDALRPVTEPVERTVAPVTKPVVDTARVVLAPRGDSPGPAAGGPTSSRDKDAAASAPGGRDTFPEADGSSTPGAAPRATDLDDSTSGAGADISTDHEIRTADRVVDELDVEVGDLDFGPRSFPDNHHHDTVSAPTTTGVVGLDDAVAPRVGRDDLLTAVLAPRDSNHGTQNFTRPDVSPG